MINKNRSSVGTKHIRIDMIRAYGSRIVRGNVEDGLKSVPTIWFEPTALNGD